MRRAGVEQCAWPRLAPRYDTALREAVTFILGRFPQTVAVVAAGTIVRGEPSASSDLDLYVVHEAAYQQRLQRFFGGVPAEIFVNPEPQIYAYLDQEHEEGRPITAHMLATGFPVLDTTEVLTGLAARARHLLEPGPPIPQDTNRSRYSLGSLF